MNTSPADLPLRDIHLPDSIAWWPPAYGWWLALGAVLLLFFLGIVLIRHYLKPTLGKDASNELDAIEKTFHTSRDAAKCLSELSILLRRAVISQKHLAGAAGLTGLEWLRVLDQPLKEPEFSQGVGQILLIGPYHYRVEDKQVHALIGLCRKWVRCL